MINVAVLFATGFEEIEGLTIVDILRRAGISTSIVGVDEKEITGAHNVTIKVDKTIEQINSDDIDALILPGGSPGFSNLKNSESTIALIQEVFNKKKIIAAICASPSVLSAAGILKDKKSTIYPGMEEEIKRGQGTYMDDIVVIDNNVITSKGPATTIPFALKIVEVLLDKKISDDIKNKLLFNEIISEG